MFHILRGLLTVAVALVGLSACSKFDNPENYDILTDYGIAYKYPGNEVADYFIKRDDGTLLFINNTAWTEEIGHGQRVKIYYQIIGKSTESVPVAKSSGTSDAKYDISLYAIIEVPVREPVMLSSINEGVIGNDPLERITRLFFSGGYLNVEYKILTNEEKGHTMNLVVDNMKYTGNAITLYIRYKANVGGNGSISSDDEESEVSFDISQLIPEEQTPLTISVIWREPGGTITKTGTYTLDPGSYKPIVGRVDKIKTSSASDVRQ